MNRPQYSRHTKKMVVLEPFTEADFDRLIGWIPSSDFLLQWAGPDFEYPLSQEQLNEHLTGTQGDLPSKLIYKVVDSENGTVIGHIELAAAESVGSVASVDWSPAMSEKVRCCGASFCPSRLYAYHCKAVLKPALVRKL